MLFRRFLPTVLAACVTAGCASTAQAQKAAAKSNKAPASSKSDRNTRARRSGPPRQISPTAERYMEFQQALADRGYYTGPVNGDWGPECVDALKHFQQDQSLAPDGKLGSLSIIALGLGPKRDSATKLSAKPEVTRPE